jgi:hypothetical protein
MNRAEALFNPLPVVVMVVANELLNFTDLHLLPRLLIPVLSGFVAGAVTFFFGYRT